jgi:uncharacterized protein
VAEALDDTRVVLVNGARQCGKSTLVTQLGNTRNAELRTLDRASVREAAIFDPATFVEAEQLLIIDEIQRVPELLLAIKERVDADPRPGQFLLTGSARVLGLKALPDTLLGRMETIELWPLAQGEIDGGPDEFVDAIFERGTDFRHRTAESRSGYIDRLVRGGFPEAVARSPRRRVRYFENYLADLVNRDVIQLAEVQRGAELRALTRLIAARSGQLLTPASLAQALGVTQHTVERYLALLEEVFLIKRIPAWSRNLSARATRTPKVAYVDSGLAAAALGQDAASLRRLDAPLGGLLEGFVLTELARQLSWSEQLAELFHYRTKDGVEVDAVIENRRGQVVALELKASTTVRGDDFSGIRHVANRLGDDLVVGAVLYAGTETLSFGERQLAIPIAALWEQPESG